MSIMGCTCGYAIKDISDEHPYAADIIPDRSSHGFVGALAAELSGYMAAKAEGKPDEWLDCHFGQDHVRLARAANENWETIRDLDTAKWLIWKHLSDYAIAAYQCPNCGRVLIQSRNESRFHSFTPDPERVIDRNLFDNRKTWAERYAEESNEDVEKAPS